MSDENPYRQASTVEQRRRERIHHSALAELNKLEYDIARGHLAAPTEAIREDARHSLRIIRDALANAT